MIKRFKKRDGNMVFIIKTDLKTFVKATSRILETKGNRSIWRSKKVTVAGTDKFCLEFGVRIAIRKVKLDIEGRVRSIIDRELRKQVGWIRAGKAMEDTVLRQAKAKKQPKASGAFPDLRELKDTTAEAYQKYTVDKPATED